jgi:4-diphosphocytidyl-2-C-methyl-D-erythritol kinase
MALRVTAPAKVNLSLHVTGKRDDGYHLLDSLVAFTEFGDVLTIDRASECSLVVTGAFAAALQAETLENNLVLKAARLLQKMANVNNGARITLEKNIPIGAGLGGGSADAAAALVGLRRFWNIDYADQLLFYMAKQLGSDVPVCLDSRTVWMRGIGEQLSATELQGDWWLVLVNPRETLLTKNVFSRFDGVYKPEGQALAQISDVAWMLESLENDLQAPATLLMPVIDDIVRRLSATEGCRVARMTGSGATCFGLYASQLEAQQAYKEISRAQPHWWAVASRLNTERQIHG